jgi:hypothetical protein
MFISINKFSNLLLDKNIPKQQKQMNISQRIVEMDHKKECTENTST